MTGEKVNLSWNSFTEATVSAFRHLGASRDFADVTLACEDGQAVQAHKAILSTCSPVLGKILLQIPPHQNHPFLFMKGMKKEEIDQMLDFIYVGEVLVEKENLENFLETANELKIAGLTLTNTDSKEDDHNGSESPLEETHQTFDHDPLVKLEAESEMVKGMGQGNSCSTCQKEFSTRTNLKAHILAMHEKNDVSCTLCDYETNCQNNLRRHKQRMHTAGKTKSKGTDEANSEPGNESVEALEILEEPEIEVFDNSSEPTDVKVLNKIEPWNSFEDAQDAICQVCEKHFHNKGNLKKHKLAIHENVKHACKFCSFQSGFAANLKSHVKNKHTQ